jgi:hypothetical protein
MIPENADEARREWVRCPGLICHATPASRRNAFTADFPDHRSAHRPISSTTIEALPVSSAARATVVVSTAASPTVLATSSVSLEARSATSPTMLATTSAAGTNQMKSR